MTIVDRTEKYCIVGAGSSGLTVLKNFRQLGIACDCLEREDRLGGIWNIESPVSSVYQSTHLISSKRLTEFTDFRMPKRYPAYPSHRQVWQYFCDYADHFDLNEAIEFCTPVAQIEPASPYWEVTLDGGEVRRYGGVVIANGHNWDPKWPEVPGEFDGPILHSAQYKTPDVLRDRRVLVVGAGNSGCDIAVESAQNAMHTFQSVRRGYHYLPKFLFGQPIDAANEMLLRWRLPLWLRRWISRRLIRVVLGQPEQFGLPRPDHKLFETHPIINSQMLYYVGHGEITVKPDVAELCGDRVRFADGSDEPIDVLIYATGFRITFPFIDRAHLNWRNDRPELYLNVFHPQHDNLFVAGLIQPDSGQWGLVNLQAELIARYLVAKQQDIPVAAKFQRAKQTENPDLAHGIHYIASSRHLLEVEHFSYRRRLEKWIKRLT